MFEKSGSLKVEEEVNVDKLSNVHHFQNKPSRNGEQAIN